MTTQCEWEQVKERKFCQLTFRKRKARKKNEWKQWKWNNKSCHNISLPVVDLTRPKQMLSFLYFLFGLNTCKLKMRKWKEWTWKNCVVFALIASSEMKNVRSKVKRKENWIKFKASMKSATYLFFFFIFVVVDSADMPVVEHWQKGWHRCFYAYFVY